MDTDNKPFSATHLYQVWRRMRKKCYNMNDDAYKDYGARGITVYEEWNNSSNFIIFHNWAYANGYKYEKLPNGKNKWTLDRIDVNGNYEPSNCRWVTQAVQNKNKRVNSNLCCIDSPIWEGKTVREICKKYNIHVTAFYRRLKKGFSVEEALTLPHYETLRKGKHCNNSKITKECKQ